MTYAHFAYRLSTLYPHIERCLVTFLQNVQKILEKEGITYRIEHRIKSIESAWEKTQRKGCDLEALYDLIGVRVILPTFQPPK